MVWRLVGHLDRGALAAALDGLVERHEALRTTLGASGDTLQQLIWPARPVPLAEVDLSGRGAGRRLRRLLAAELRAPFDISPGAGEPLLRARLVRLGATDHIIMLIVHHTVADGWSTAVLLRDFQALYAAAVTGRPPALARLALQLADYSAWEREFSDAALEAHWRARLRDVPGRLDLHNGNGAARGFAGRPRPLPRVSAATIRALASVARQERASLSACLCACVAAALAPYADGGVSFCLIDANRDRPELQPVVGWLANFLLLQVDVAGDPTFRALTRRVRDGWGDAFEHRMPFVALYRLLGPGARDEPFDAVFNSMPQAPPPPPAQLPGPRGGVRLTPIDVPFDLLRLHSDAGRLLAAGLDYQLRVDARHDVNGFLMANEHEHAPARLDGLGRELVHVLRGAALHPDRPIGRLALDGRHPSG